MKSFWTRPFTDAFFGLDRCLDSGWRGFGLVGLGLVAGWWIYVPIHELLHAFACMATGGTVHRLEIAPLYLGHWFASVIPWVEAGGEYAGRLSGFDTGGSDLVYLATDFGPFLLTLFPGVWLLRRFGRRGAPLLFGSSLAVGLAPLTSLTGDAFEIGSIVVTWFPPWSDPETMQVLRSDDLLRTFGALAEQGAGLVRWVGTFLSALLGAAWALATYAAGAAIAERLGEPAIEAVASEV